MKKTIDKALVVVLLAITCIGAVAWNLQTPIISDDLNYMVEVTPGDLEGFWGCAGDDIQNFGEAVQSACNHYGLVNGRLANCLHILFVPFGRIPEGIVLGMVIAALAFAMAWVASGGRVSAAIIVLSIFMMWTAFPWFDQFQSFDYQINYTLPSVMALAVIWFLSAVTAMRRRSFAGLLILGFLTGWMHEGFALPLCAYIFFFWIVRERRFEDRRLLYVLAAVFIGFLVDGFGGTFGRAESNSEIFKLSSLGGLLTRMLSQMWIAALALCMFGFAIFRQKHDGRKELLAKYLPWFMAAFCGWCIAIAVVQIDRTLWPAELFFAMIVLSLINRFLCRISIRVSAVVCALFAAVYALWMVQLVRWEKLIGDENRELFSSVPGRNPDQIKIAYGYLTPGDDVPWYLLDIVNQPLEHWLRQRSFWEYFVRRRTLDTMIMPEDCKDRPFEEWPAVSSDGIVRGRWPWLACSDTLDIAKVTVTFGSPGANMPPVDRMLVMLREGLNPSATAAMVEVWTMSVMMPDSTYLRRIQIMPLPRTLRHRPILDIKLSGPDTARPLGDF